jgi:hypothetical protein
MPEQHWARLQQVFVQAVAQPLAGRAEWVRRACGDDAEMAQRVLRMLAHDDAFMQEADDPLADIVGQAARRALADTGGQASTAALNALRGRLVQGARTGLADNGDLGRAELLAFDAAVDALAERDAELARLLLQQVFGGRAQGASAHGDAHGQGRPEALAQRLAFAQAWVVRHMHAHGALHR